MAEEEENEKKKKKKNSSKYNYNFGDLYPGVVIGHKNCLYFKPGLPVPSNMGWLWNATDIPGLKFRRGWQPGVIGKSVAKMMTFKCPRGGPEKDKNKNRRKKRKGPGPGYGGQGPGGGPGPGPGSAQGQGGGGYGGGGGGGGGRRGAGGGRGGGRGTTAGDYYGGGDSEAEEPLEPKPTLKVQRKGDVFTIQVNPLKDLTEIMPNEDPYVDCDPMIFKIIKKRSPEEQAKVEARKMIKLKRQRDAEIRKALAEAVEDICKCAYMDVFCNDLTAIDKVIDSCPAFKDPECICKEESLSSLSSNATWDIEYTPPFGCFDLAPRKQKAFIHVETQYIPADAGITEPPPKQPKCKRSCSSLKPKKRISRRSCCGPCAC